MAAQWDPPTALLADEEMGNGYLAEFGLDLFLDAPTMFLHWRNANYLKLSRADGRP